MSKCTLLVEIVGDSADLDFLGEVIGPMTLQQALANTLCGIAEGDIDATITLDVGGDAAEPSLRRLCLAELQRIRSRPRPTMGFVSPGEELYAEGYAAGMDRMVDFLEAVIAR